MSWISGLADKAEDILNKIDKNAATALQIPANNLPDILAISDQPKTERSKVLVPQWEGSSIATEVNQENDEYGSGAKVLVSGIVSNKGLAMLPYNCNADAVTIDHVEDNALNVGGPEINIINSKSIEIKVDPNEMEIPLIVSSNKLSEALSHLPSCIHQSNDTTIAELKERIKELEILNENLTTQYNQTRCKLTEIQSVDSSYAQSVAELESSLLKLRKEYLDVTQKLQMQIEETTQQGQEFQEYKAKAHRALQMKDNLINELKASLNNDTAISNFNGDNNELNCLKLEMQSLRDAYKNLQDENFKIRKDLIKAEEGVRRLQELHSEKLEASQTIEEDLRKKIRLEEERSMRMESENRIISQELTTLQQQLAKQFESTAQTLRRKDQLIQQLKAERNEGSTDADFSDYNIRINSLTQSLIDKQNTLESVTVDRNALRLQLEKIQIQLQQKNQSNNSSNSPRNALLSNTTDDVKAQFPALMRETPFDSRVSRRVKRAYSSLDSAGIRLGAFLRRYPLIRIFVLMYVGLLHVWVVFVLLFSTPT